jgi:uncharacterized metal-binding protein
MNTDATLYNEHYLAVMKQFDTLSDMSCNRIELIRDLALGLKFKTIGLANCVMFNRETKAIEQYLSKDFNVHKVNCKYGRLTRNDLFNDGNPRIICNPAGQAEFLNENKTDMNLSIGLCVGHDMVFNCQSKAPVTTLFTKDFTNNNDPSVAINDIR